MAICGFALVFQIPALGAALFFGGIALGERTSPDAGDFVELCVFYFALFGVIYGLTC